jgi:hypothetical protein
MLEGHAQPRIPHPRRHPTLALAPVRLIVMRVRQTPHRLAHVAMTRAIRGGGRAFHGDRAIVDAPSMERARAGYPIHVSIVDSPSMESGLSRARREPGRRSGAEDAPSMEIGLSRMRLPWREQGR